MGWYHITFRDNVAVAARPPVSAPAGEVNVLIVDYRGYGDSEDKCYVHIYAYAILCYIMS